MKSPEQNFLINLFWIASAVNILFSFLVLPLLIQPDPPYTHLEFLETLLWQGLSLIAWPIALPLGVAIPLVSGSLPPLKEILSLSLYPLIEFSLLLTLILKRYKWIPFLISHILFLTSMAITWKAVLRGYNFMVG
jgi:hypothetical protein